MQICKIHANAGKEKFVVVYEFQSDSNLKSSAVSNIIVDLHIDHGKEKEQFHLLVVVLFLLSLS